MSCVYKTNTKGGHTNMTLNCFSCRPAQIEATWSGVWAKWVFGLVVPGVMEPPVSNSIWHIFATDSISLGFVMLAVTFIMLVGVPAPQPGELWSHHNSHSKPYPPRGWALQTFDFPSGVQWQICIINMRVISTDAT